MVIVIYAGYQSIKLCPTLLNEIGVGGTEQCIINLATEFARDNEVYVTGDVVNYDLNNVMYRDVDNLRKDLYGKDVDWVIGVSYINYLLELEFLNFKKSFFWVHNTDFYPWYRGEVLENEGVDYLHDKRLRYIVCLTQWHKNNFINTYNVDEHKVIVIGNGIDTTRFKKTTNKIKNSFIYSSHAERGLQRILNEWEHIQKQYSNATLNIATPQYGLDYFNDYFLDQIKNDSTIKFHGSLSCDKLYNLMSKSMYWYYPTEYEETFCITALEMLGHGVKPITSGIMKVPLKETLNNFDLRSLNNAHLEFDKTLLHNYIEKCKWENIKSNWYEYIYLDTNKEKNGKKEKFNLDCVYVLSLKPSDDDIERWKHTIRNDLFTWYDGPIICKKATNGASVSQQWLEDRNYSLYNGWKLTDHENSFWSGDMKPVNLVVRSLIIKYGVMPKKIILKTF